MNTTDAAEIDVSLADYLGLDTVTERLARPGDPKFLDKGTFSTIFLPPSPRINNDDEAKAWAATMIEVLTKKQLGDANDRCALDNPWVGTDKEGDPHLILISSTEFCFGATTNGDTPTVDPIDFKVFEIAIGKLHEEMCKDVYNQSTIVLSLSCVVKYGVYDEKGKEMAENALFVVNNCKSTTELGTELPYGMQKIAKFRSADGDGWDLPKNERFVDLSKRNKGKSPDNITRQLVHTHTIKDFIDGEDPLVISFGTCYDISLELFPGSNLVVFVAADLPLRNMRDMTDYGLILSDTLHFVGERLKPGLRTYDAFPTLEDAAKYAAICEQFYTDLKAKVDASDVVDKAGTMDAYRKLDLVENRVELQAACSRFAVDFPKDVPTIALRLNFYRQLADKCIMKGLMSPDFDVRDKFISDWKVVDFEGNRKYFESLMTKVEMLWPISLAESTHYYRYGDHERLDAEIKIVYGKPQRIPKRPYKIGIEAIPVSWMRFFADEASFVEFRNTAWQHAIDNGMPEPKDFLGLVECYVAAREAASISGGAWGSNDDWELALERYRPDEEIPEISISSEVFREGRKGDREPADGDGRHTAGGDHRNEPHPVDAGNTVDHGRHEVDKEPGSHGGTHGSSHGEHGR